MAVLESLGYFFVGLFFIFYAIFDGVYFHEALYVLRKRNIPFAKPLLQFGILWELTAGLMILINFYPNYAALSLIPLVIISVFILHPFWKYRGNEWRIQLLFFMTNITVTLAVLFFIANG